ncbi:trp operon leader peptide [Cronobacter sakazakii]|nr:trp operon leader peptide [Cronobacter sakazakii]ELY4590723.1 trp operon leader peptide [Cronobacter sakazakii]
MNHIFSLHGWWRTS